MVLPGPQWPSVAAIRELVPPLGLLESPTQVLFRRRMAEKTPADPPRSFLHDHLLLLSLPSALPGEKQTVCLAGFFCSLTFPGNKTTWNLC